MEATPRPALRTPFPASSSNLANHPAQRAVAPPPSGPALHRPRLFAMSGPLEAHSDDGPAPPVAPPLQRALTHPPTSGVPTNGRAPRASDPPLPAQAPPAVIIRRRAGLASPAQPANPRAAPRHGEPTARTGKLEQQRARRGRRRGRSERPKRRGLLGRGVPTLGGGGARQAERPGPAR